MLFSPRKKSLDSLLKEFRVFKEWADVGALIGRDAEQVKKTGRVNLDHALEWTPSWALPWTPSWLSSLKD